MSILLAVLISVSGVLLDTNDKPMPKYQLVFSDANLNLIKVTTDKHGKFQVDLAPGTYRVQFGLYDYAYYPELKKAETISVDEKTSTLKLKEPTPTVIEVIQGTQGDVIITPKGPRR